MREQHTEYGRRVYYDACDVPSVIDEAREMSWRPFAGWRATVRVSRIAADPKYSLDLSVQGRWVFDGRDDDVVRLLGAFQAFLDACRDKVDEPGFSRRMHRGWAGTGAPPAPVEETVGQVA